MAIMPVINSQMISNTRQYDYLTCYLFQDAFVGHIVENDVTIHGLTVRMDQLMEQNKNFQVIYDAKVTCSRHTNMSYKQLQIKKNMFGKGIRPQNLTLFSKMKSVYEN